MENKAMIPLLVACMLLTGCCNTLFTKYQDMQCVANCDSPDPRKHKTFEQPVIQTLQMFVGESGCWIVVFLSYLYRRYVSTSPNARSEDVAYQPADTDETEPLTRRGREDTPGDEEIDPTDAPFKPFVDAESGHVGERMPLEGWNITLLALPACCDITGTTLMNVGLLFVAASIYQMTRGALVLFVGLMSVVFLKKHLAFYKWASLFVVVLGVAVVGLAGALEKKIPGVPNNDQGAKAVVHFVREVYITAKEHTPAETIVGILLIALAQIFTATQFVLEESLMMKYEMDPISVVGWEGIFGFLVTAVGMVILHFAVGRTDAGRGGYFDAKEGLSQLFNNRGIAVTSVLTMISIGGFNFFGLSVTRTVSATARSTIDTCRTLLIWVVSLGLGWETFKWLQVVGFGLLVYGTMLFNDIVRPPTVRFLRNRISLGDETPRPHRASSEE